MPEPVFRKKTGCAILVSEEKPLLTCIVSLWWWFNKNRDRNLRLFTLQLLAGLKTNLTFCTLENILWLWYLSKVVQRKRFTIFYVFPDACSGST